MSDSLIYNSGYNSGRAPNPAAFHRAVLSQCAAVLFGREPDLIETPRDQQTLAEWTKLRWMHQKRFNAARARGLPSPLEVTRAIAAHEARQGIRRGAPAAAARDFKKTRASISKLQKVAKGWRAVLEKAREYCLAVIEGRRENIPGELRVLPAILAECKSLLNEFEPLPNSNGRSSLSVDVYDEKRHLKIQTPYKVPRPR
jgi:hypothetical protein